MSMKPDSINSLFSLKDKVAIVTGAGGYFGRAFSECLLLSGAKVVLLGRGEKIERLADEFKSHFGEKVDYGIPEFCEMCARCVKTCPGKAIPGTPREVIEGKLRWQIVQENCYDRWRSLGTDCGICLSACPFSQGVDASLFDQMRDDKEIRKAILKKHQDEYGIRKFIKEPLDILNPKLLA